MCYIENDDAINCTMQIPNTNWKIMFTQFSKERYKIIIFPTNDWSYFNIFEDV